MLIFNQCLKIFLAQVKQLVQECLQKNKTLKFVDLWNVERWVINASRSDDIRSFEDFGHGSFLKFITSDKSLKDRVISNLDIGNGSSGFAVGTGISKEDVKEFIKQCFSKTTNKVKTSVGHGFVKYSDFISLNVVRCSRV